jgi:hypothetical protein
LVDCCVWVLNKVRWTKGKREGRKEIGVRKLKQKLNKKIREVDRKRILLAYIFIYKQHGKSSWRMSIHHRPHKEAKERYKLYVHGITRNEHHEQAETLNREEYVIQ